MLQSKQGKRLSILIFLLISDPTFAIPNQWWAIGVFQAGNQGLAEAQNEAERSVADKFPDCIGGTWIPQHPDVHGVTRYEFLSSNPNCTFQPSTVITWVTRLDCGGEEIGEWAGPPNKGYGDGVYHCVASCTWPNVRDPITNQCIGPRVDKKSQSCPVGGNPISLAIGNKFQREVDYTGVTSPVTHLQFVRYYNSEPRIPDADIGDHWRHSYDRALEFVNLEFIYARRPNGDGVAFRLSVAGMWVSDADQNVSLEPDTTDWLFTDENQTVERYNTNGQLTEITDRAGFSTTLHYGDDGDVATLDRVSGHFGAEITLSYIDNHDSSKKLVHRLTLPDGTVVQYGYDHPSSDRLKTVMYPDEGGTITRTYYYEDPTYANALTRIVDGNGDTFATWRYDNIGRAEFSANGINGANQIDLLFDTDGSVRVTQTIDSANAVFQDNTHHFAVNQQVKRSAQIDGGPCSNCGAISQQTMYDTNGYPSKRVDFEGNETKFEHNSSGLELCRVEGIHTDTSKKALRLTTTTWHPESRLKEYSRVFSPDPQSPPAEQCPAMNSAGIPTDPGWVQMSSTYTDYTSGRLVERTESDHTSFAEPDRTTIYTYYDSTAGTGDPSVLDGLLKRVDGPRSDVDDIVEYVYYESDDITNGHYHTGDLHYVRRYLDDDPSTPEYHETAFTEYDANGRVKKVIDPNGLVTTMTYHPRGWLTSRTVDGHTTVFDYDNVGQLDKVTLPDGSFLDYTYDAAHRLTDMTDNLGNKIHYALDAMGNRTQEDTKDPSDTLTRQVERVYNTLNQHEKLIAVIETTPSVKHTTGYTYDANGNLKQTIDPRDPGITATGPLPTTPTVYGEHTYDALNRVLSTRDNLGGVTTFAYDVFDNVTSVVDPEGLETRYVYNGFGELRQSDSPNLDNPAVGATVLDHDTTYTYDTAGNRVTTAQAEDIAAGRVVAYTYDAMNRLTRIDYVDDTLDVTFVYDENVPGQHGVGRLTTMTDGSGTTTYQYDVRGNTREVTTTRGGHTHTTGYTYNGADLLETLTYPSGRVVTFHYRSSAPGEGSSLVEKVTTVPHGQSATLVENVQYAPFGPVAAWTYGNGATMSRGYDLSYRITSLLHGLVVDREYEIYDAVGNIKSIVDHINAGGSQSLVYDDLDRLTDAEATGSYGTRVQMYDGVGNRTQQTVDGVLFNYHYEIDTQGDLVSQRLEAITNGVTETNAYDMNGNLIERGSPSETFTYGQDNRMKEATVGGVLAATYSHNGLGERVAKDDGLSTIYYHYDLSGQLIAETDESGATLKEYAYLDGAPMALFDYEGDIAPTVVIGAGLDGLTVAPGATIHFSATGDDADDGDLSANIVWTSNHDGEIGTGAAFSTSGLSVGVHTITATITDSVGQITEQEITVTVTDGSGLPLEAILLLLLD